ncbi:uncharacterized protein LOC107866015 [Capsicum annuum]|uniref:uncharacterized protein LOC107866015 n=1 Tax=Capsicum annuum TaxID=4072 RepID=UPI001FB15D48|nr:uncharacterized protein LOC107866015 [Capsicum annuum]
MSIMHRREGVTHAGSLPPSPTEAAGGTIIGGEHCGGGEPNVGTLLSSLSAAVGGQCCGGGGGSWVPTAITLLPTPAATTATTETTIGGECRGGDRSWVPTGGTLQPAPSAAATGTAVGRECSCGGSNGWVPIAGTLLPAPSAATTGTMVGRECSWRRWCLGNQCRNYRPSSKA